MNYSEDISCTTSAALLPSHVFELEEGGKETSELKQFLLPLDENVCGLKQTYKRKYINLSSHALAPVCTSACLIKANDCKLASIRSLMRILLIQC